MNDPVCQTDTIRLIDPDYFRKTLQRLPLANATIHLLGYAWDKSSLVTCYEANRGQCYEDILDFPRLVELLSDALLVHHGSGRQALLYAKKQGTLPIRPRAFYGKLGRLPLDLSVAFLTEASQRLNDLLPAQDNPLPASLHAYQVRIIDGKKTKHIAKKLKLTRDQAGQLFGSKLLVAYDPATRLIQTLTADRDGEKNDGPLVPGLLAQLPTPPSRPRIILADAQFCDLVQISLYAKNGDHFALRYHPKLHFHRDPATPRREFTDAKGRPLIEEYGWLGSPADPRRRFVRCITWKRTDHHKDMTVVTDLTLRSPGQETAEPEAIPAADLIDLYLTRWTIETVFQEVTELFGLRKLIGSTPEATVFQAAFCMVVYNAIQVVKSYVAAVQTQPMKVDDVSSAMLFTSIREELTAMAVLVPAASLVELVTPLLTAAAARAYLREQLTGLWEPGWKKARNKNPRVYKVKPKGSGAHTSVYRVLQKHKKSKSGSGSG